ncbi:hypothetical protein ACWIFK_30390, partial [Streptomyces althioticus]
LHLVAAADSDDTVGRPRKAGERADEPLIELAQPDADEVAGRHSSRAGLPRPHRAQDSARQTASGPSPEWRPDGARLTPARGPHRAV